MKVGLGESLSIKRSTDGALVSGGSLSAESTAHAESSNKIRPEIIEGTLDLTEWHLQTDGPAALGGQWLFGWEKASPKRSSGQSSQARLAQRFPVPARWEGKVHPLEEGERLGRYGFATYALRVMLPPYERERHLEFKALMMAARVGVHRIDGDGQVRSVFQNAGTFTTGTDEPSTNNAYRRLRFPVPASTQASELILTIELSNHATSFLSAGVFGSPYALRQQRRIPDQDPAVGGYLFSLGVCFMIGLYHLIVYFFRRQNLPALYFGMFCLRTSAIFSRVISRCFGPSLVC